MTATTPAKTVFITGCSSGIGLATAKHFQAQGWNVAATMRNPADAPELAQLPNVICPALDVHDTAAINRALQETVARFGRIDVVVNNAGYALMGAFETLAADQVRRQFETNVFGLMEVTRAALALFRAQRGGTVVNVSSMVGRIPLPLYSIYNASKHAVEGFTEGLTYELDNLGIRVKLVEPGAVNTNFFGRSADRGNQTGVSAYNEYSDYQFAVMDRTGPGGSRPEDAAKVIFRAAGDRSRRLRYSVGPDALMLLATRRFMPETLFRMVIRLSLTPAAFNSVGRLLYKVD